MVYNKVKLAYFPYINAVALVAVITVNALANILPINNLTTGEVSAFYPSLFTPAGFTFSIWGIIYLMLIVFVISQSLITRKTFYPQLSRWFIVSCIANIFWIIAWHFLKPELSVLLMIGLLFSLVRIFQLFKKNEELAFWPWVTSKLPFVLYLSWICVATIANIAAALIHLGWQGAFLTPVQWTIFMVALASLLGSFISISRKEPAFILVTMWALFGIYSKWNGTELVVISNNAIFWIVALAFLFIFQLTIRMTSKVFSS